MFSKIRNSILISAALFVSACATPEDRVRIAPDGSPLVNLIELRDDYFAANPAEKEMVLKANWGGRGFSFGRNGEATFLADKPKFNAESQVIPGEGTRVCVEPSPGTRSSWPGACLEAVGTSVDGMRIYYRYGPDGDFFDQSAQSFVQKQIVLVDGVPRPAR